MPAAAIAIPAVATLLAGKESSDATNNATKAAVSQQQQALQQQAQLSQPYRDLGSSAIPTLQSLLGIGAPGGPNPTDTLRATPGYEFAKQQGLDATKNAASASGMLLSGNTLEGLDKFSTGLADQTYQQTVGNLQNVVGTGQAAAAGQAANVGNAAANTSNLTANQGYLNAGIDANTIAGLGKIAANYFNDRSQQATLAGLIGQSGGMSDVLGSGPFGLPGG